MNTKFGYGNKEDIITQIESSALDEGDLVITKDTNEIVFIDPEKNQKAIKSRTEKAYTLNGTDLGALKNGETIDAGISIDDLLKLITQKAIPATYNKPTVTISRTGGSTAGTFEAGTSISVNLKSDFTKNDAGDITDHKIYKNSDVIHEGGASASTTFNVEAFTLGDETVNFKSEASYADGPIKNNNLDQPSPDGQIKAGKINSNNLSFTGQRNLFYGTGVGELPELNSATVRALTGKKLNPTQGYSWNINIAIGQQYVIFAYPNTLRDVNQVMYVETNDTGMASSFTKTEVEVEGANAFTAKTYKVYSYRMAAPAAAPMTFKVTI